MSTGSGHETTPAAGQKAGAGRMADDSDEPVLPTRSREDSEQAWGDGDGRRDDEWYRRERPPHHE